MAGITNKELRKIAVAIGDHAKLIDLGFELNFQHAEIQGFKATNRSDGQVTANGTSTMLFAWKEKVSKINQRTQLREALTEVGLVSIAEDHLSESSSTGAAATSSSQPPSQSDNRSTSGMAVTEEQVEHLSKIFPNSQYTSFCSALGYDYNEAQGVLTKYNNDNKKAVMEIVMMWKTRTEGSSEDLKNALKKAGAAGLIRKIGL